MRIWHKGLFVILSTFSLCINACDNSSESYIGSLCWTAASFCPTGTLQANGASIPIASYEALYAVIGSSFGASSSMFNLPNLNDREAVGQGSKPGLVSIALGQKLGNDIAPPVLPKHTHAVSLGPVVILPFLTEIKSRG